DAPHYMRIAMQRGKQEPSPKKGMAGSGGHHSAMNAISRGCLAGVGFCFISHVGRVQGCGYLDVEAGNIRKESFSRIWSDSPVFGKLRDLSGIRGKCGVCEYKRLCGGCRARAYEATGNYLEAEPYCVYEPTALSQSHCDF
ncbi:MAG: SPASM domain-containing protein, partial [Dehalococcoidia bacterium]